MPKIKISIMGAAGRMGRELIRAVVSNQSCTLLGGIEPAGSPHCGKDLGELAGIGAFGTTVTDNALPLIARSDAIIDFTSPKATAEFSGYAANARITHVIGTTGLDKDTEAALLAAARHATIIKSSNMSLGVNLVAALTKKIAHALNPEYDIEILEMHHRNKVDAPSGTALMLGSAAAEGRGINLSDCSIRSRDGNTGPRRRGDIGFATLRGGSVVGDHAVIFAGEGEEITIRHNASDRGIFARGAVTAALWGQEKGPGLFSMSDVLGI